MKFDPTKPPTNIQEALTSALYLAITASTDAKEKEAADLAACFASQVTVGDIERAKAMAVAAAQEVTA